MNEQRIAFIYDPLAAANATTVSNTILYGSFPICVRRRGQTVRKELSTPARLTYIGLRSLDWSGQGRTWYSWAAICDLLRLSRRTLAEHLEELEAAGLIQRERQPNGPSGTTVYRWCKPPLREVWRTVMLKRWRCGFEPEQDRIVRPDGSPPRTRAEFDRLFESWWALHRADLEHEWSVLRLAEMGIAWERIEELLKRGPS